LRDRKGGTVGSDVQRLVEIRLMVLVMVNVSDPTFTDALIALGVNPSSVADVVSSEVVSNLESVSYIETVIVSQW
jgi:hypothetical protein